MCHVHLTGTRMPFLHLGNLGDMRLDFAAQLLQVLLAMWKPRNVWCCLKENMDQRFAQLLLFFFCEVELRGGLNSEPALRRKACFPEVASPYHSFNFELDGNVPENVYALYNFHDRKVPRIGVQENSSVSAWPNEQKWSGCLGGS